MTRRTLHIEGWEIDFLFSLGNYDIDGILSSLYYADAPDDKVQQALDLIDSCKHNCGFTFFNPFNRRIVVLFGPVDSAPQFLNTFVHEIRHIADFISNYYDIRLDSEPPAYLSGYIAMELADMVFAQDND